MSIAMHMKSNRSPGTCAALSIAAQALSNLQIFMIGTTCIKTCPFFSCKVEERKLNQGQIANAFNVRLCTGT
uniref:Uncharacterized protein n=1 Tax=Solanum lycopersicum TaxID=4081 RepID=A0A3Q7IAM1_SOLLC